MDLCCECVVGIGMCLYTSLNTWSTSVVVLEALTYNFSLEAQ